MKAQMFVLTIVFLVGLVYVVQQNIADYSVIDFSEPFQDDDYYIFQNFVNIFESTVVTTETCDDAGKNVNELLNFISRKLLYGGFTPDLDYILDCSRWNNLEPSYRAPLNVTIKMIGKQSETSAKYEFYHLVPPEIMYASYENMDDEFNPCPLNSDDEGHPLNAGENLEITAQITDPNGDTVTAWVEIYLEMPGSRWLQATETLYDDGTNGDVHAGDNIFTYVWTIPSGACPPNQCSGTIIVQAMDGDYVSQQDASCLE